MAPSVKQQIEPPADEWELSAGFLRKHLLEPFSKARRPIEEAKEIMRNDGVSEQLINQNMAWEKGAMERHYAKTIKLTTNPRTGLLWDLNTMSIGGMISEAERQNIIRVHNGREPPYYYVTNILRIWDDRANKSYLKANFLFEGILVGKRENVINAEAHRRINTSWTIGEEYTIPVEWNTTRDPYDKMNTGEEKSVASYNSYSAEGGNSPPIYTIPFSKEMAEKLISLGKDGAPPLAVKKLSTNRAYGIKSV